MGSNKIGFFSPNIAGVIAILMWSISALLISYTGKVPAFLLASMVFAICSFFYFAKWIINRENFLIYFKTGWKNYLTFLLGVGGYIAFYYTAFKLAPPIEVNLLNYMWPIFLVIVSSIATRKKIKLQQILGIALGFLGVFSIFIYSGDFNLNGGFIWGYASAVLGAFVWALYSTITRKVTFTANNMSAFNIVLSVLFFIMHKSFEETIMPTGSEWVAVVFLGATTTSYMFWDYAMKKGDIDLIASLSYFTPFLSVLMLALFQDGNITLNIVWSVIAILTGCLLVNYEIKFKKS